MRPSTRRLLVTGALALGLPLVGPAPAWAEGSIVAPAAGVQYVDDTVVRVEAEVEPRSAETQLRLVDPNGIARTVDSVGPALGAQTLRFALDTACPEYPGSACSGRRPAPNGTWTAQLTGGATGSRSFVLRIPPRAPGEVRAEAVGPREVVVTWQRGTEPDLRDHDVVDGDGRVLADGDDDCPTGTCRTVVRYEADGPGTAVVAVRAARAACPGCDQQVTTTSEPVTVTRPAPASPPGAGAPEEGPGPAGGEAPAGGGTGDSDPGDLGSGGPSAPSPGPSGSSTPGPGTAAPGAAPAPGPSSAPTGGTGQSGDLVLGAPASQAAASAPGFEAFGPEAGLPEVPPLPAPGVALPSVAPPEDGGFAAALPFGDQVVRERVAAGPAARVGGAVGDVVRSAVDSEGVARSLAASLLLLLAGGHLRLWLGREPAGQERAG